jgi:uracil-DNA glycosylase family 4
VPEQPREPPDERSELADLAAGLGAHLKRNKAAGKRRVRAPKASEAAAPAPRGGLQVPPRSQPAPERVRPDKGLLIPVPPPLSSPRSTLPNPARSAAEAMARGVRDQAKACKDLAELQRGVAACTACGLSSTRTQTVFADGSGKARLMFVGEAPGAEEDARGVPFVGRAGQLLTDILTKGMGLARADVYICNVLKCRPPENRDPTEAEKLTCTPWLDRQIELVDPEVIVPLGRHAANHVLGTELPMGKLRGQVFERNGRKVVPTFHPAYLLRSPSMKKECWKDIQLAMGLLGLEPPGKTER